LSFNCVQDKSVQNTEYIGLFNQEYGLSTSLSL
jgi:hypothetical protein